VCLNAPTKGALNILRDLTKYLVGAILSALGYLLLSIYSDVLTVIFPALQEIPQKILLKIILFVVTLLALSIILNFILWLKSKPSRPDAMNGKFCKVPWMAEIDYSGREILTHIHWHCPKHKIKLIDNSVPNSQEHVLHCNKCNKDYPMISGDANIDPREAWNIIHNEILQRVSTHNH